MTLSTLNAVPADTTATKSLVCIGGGTEEAPAPAVQTLDAEAGLGARAGKGNWRELDSPLAQLARALMRITRTETASVVTAKNDAPKTTTANRTPPMNMAAITHPHRTTASAMISRKLLTQVAITSLHHQSTRLTTRQTLMPLLLLTKALTIRTRRTTLRTTHRKARMHPTTRHEARTARVTPLLVRLTRMTPSKVTRAIRRLRMRPPHEDVE